MNSERIRLAIADDNSAFVELFREFVQPLSDVELVAAASDGEEILEAIIQMKPDVVVLDLVMPRLDGLGVLEKLNVTPTIQRPKVIMLTAFGQEEITKKVLELGADYHVLKPFSMEVLLTRIRQVAKTKKTHAPITAPERANSSEDDISQILSDIGVPAHIRGYMYLREAIQMILQGKNDLLGSVTKELYPRIAEKYASTDSRVERSIRHAIAVVWERGDAQMTQKMFAHASNAKTGKPTNSEFMAVIADRVRRGYRK